MRMAKQRVVRGIENTIKIRFTGGTVPGVLQTDWF